MEIIRSRSMKVTSQMTLSNTVEEHCGVTSNQPEHGTGLFWQFCGGIREEISRVFPIKHIICQTKSSAKNNKCCSFCVLFVQRFCFIACMRTGCCRYLYFICLMLRVSNKFGFILKLCSVRTECLRIQTFLYFGALFILLIISCKCN